MGNWLQQNGVEVLMPSAIIEYSNVNGRNITLQQGRNPSILTGNPHELLREFAGRGERVPKNDREVVDTGRVVGRYFCRERRRFFDTTRITIHYNRSGQAHIVPALPREMLPR